MTRNLSLPKCGTFFGCQLPSRSSLFFWFTCDVWNIIVRDIVCYASLGIAMELQFTV